MIPTLALAALGLAHLSSAYGLRTEVPMARCGAPDPTRAQMEAAQALGLGNNTDLFRTETVTINTYFHIVATSMNEEDGYLSDQAVEKQLKVLNDDYAGSGFNFSLAATSRTVNEDWALSSNLAANERAMKSELRRGSYADLNLYFLTSLNDVLGYCYFPVASPSDSDVTQDGCSILASTVPGGTAEGYNLGRTATHEVGHWLGLFHTFQGGCADDDKVADTPAQESPSSGCPVGRDSCPGGGPDPIHNYMDYSDDTCLEEFTPGQETRMQSSWAQYRA